MGTGGVIGRSNRPTTDSADGRWQGYNPSSGAAQGVTGSSGKSASGVYSLADASQQIAAGRWPVPASSITYLGHFTTLDINMNNYLSVQNIPQDYDDLLLYYDAMSDLPSGASETDIIFPMKLYLYTTTTGTGSVIPMYTSQFTNTQASNGSGNTYTDSDYYMGMSKAVDWTAVTGGPVPGWEGDTFRYSAFNQLHIVNYRQDNGEGSVVPVCWIYGISLQEDADRFRTSRSYGALGPSETQPVRSLSLWPRDDQSHIRVRGLLYGVKK